MNDMPFVGWALFESEEICPQFLAYTSDIEVKKKWERYKQHIIIELYSPTKLDLT